MYINVLLLDMDTMIPEQISKNCDDGYTIFLNARHSQEQRLKSYYHAIWHIKNGDFDGEDIQKIEMRAHE